MGVPFKGEMNRATLFKAVSLVSKQSKTSVTLRIAGSITLIGLLLWSIITKIQGGSDLTTVLFKSGRHIFTVGASVYFLLRPFFSVYRTTSDLWKNLADQPLFFGEFSSQGITLAPEAENPVHISWEQIAMHRFIDDLFVLLTADGMLMSFPRYYFSSAEDWFRANELSKLRVVEAN